MIYEKEKKSRSKKLSMLNKKILVMMTSIVLGFPFLMNSGCHACSDKKVVKYQSDSCQKAWIN